MSWGLHLPEVRINVTIFRAGCYEWSLVSLPTLSNVPAHQSPSEITLVPCNAMCCTVTV